MAARKEIWDLILLHGDPTTPPNFKDVDKQIQLIVNKYNEQQADQRTLENDTWELALVYTHPKRYFLLPPDHIKKNDKGEDIVVYKTKIGDRVITAIKDDFRLAIICLLQCALDWGIILPKGEIKKYERVHFKDGMTLALYISNLYNGTKTNNAVMETKEKLLNHYAFKKALNKGIVTQTDRGFKWNKYNLTALAYFLGRLFGYKRQEQRNKENRPPWKSLEEIFGLSKHTLRQSLSQYYYNGKRQQWQDEIDELF